MNSFDKKPPKKQKTKPLSESCTMYLYLCNHGVNMHAKINVGTKVFTFVLIFPLTPPSEGLGYQINWVDIKYSCPQTAKFQMLTKIENV